MSASVGDSGTNYLDTNSLSGLSEANQILKGLWFKRSSGHTPGSSQTISALANGTTHPSAILTYSATPNLHTSINGGSNTDTGDAIGNSAFQHIAWLVGPLGASGSNIVRRVWLDGTEIYNSNASGASTGSITRLRLFAGLAGTILARGKIAEVGLWADPASAATLVSQMQTYSPIALSPLYAWRLFDDFDSDVGSANLTATGTVTSDTGDHPSLTLTAPPASGRRRGVVFI